MQGTNKDRERARERARDRERERERAIFQCVTYISKTNNYQQTLNLSSTDVDLGVVEDAIIICQTLKLAKYANYHQGFTQPTASTVSPALRSRY